MLAAGFQPRSKRYPWNVSQVKRKGQVPIFMLFESNTTVEESKATRILYLSYYFKTLRGAQRKCGETSQLVGSWVCSLLRQLFKAACNYVQPCQPNEHTLCSKFFRLDSRVPAWRDNKKREGCRYTLNEYDGQNEIVPSDWTISRCLVIWTFCLVRHFGRFTKRMLLLISQHEGMFPQIPPNFTSKLEKAWPFRRVFMIHYGNMGSNYQWATLPPAIT